jgi:glutaredoxin 3
MMDRLDAVDRLITLRKGMIRATLATDQSAYYGGVPMQTHTIEVFSAGCPICLEALRLVHALAGQEWRVRIYDMETGDAFAKAREYGITRVPSVVIDGQLPTCCQAEALSEGVLRDLLQSRREQAG